jgi:hypothetical protein
MAKNIIRLVLVLKVPKNKEKAQKSPVSLIGCVSNFGPKFHINLICLP